MTASSDTLRTSSRGAVANRARYLAGSIFNFGGQAAQQVQTFRLSTSTGIGSPIEPSLAPVTGQTFCSSTVGFSPSAVRDEVNRVRNSGESATDVLSVTVANMPGRSRWPGLSSANRTSTVRVV